MSPIPAMRMLWWQQGGGSEKTGVDSGGGLADRPSLQEEGRVDQRASWGSWSGGPALSRFSGRRTLLRAAACREHRVVEQHRACHRADAAGHGRNRCRLLADGVVVDVADEAAAALLRGVGDAIDADVDDDRALAHHVGSNAPGRPIATMSMSAWRVCLPMSGVPV